MKYLPIIFSLVFLCSCNNQAQEEKETVQEKQVVLNSQETETELEESEEKEPEDDFSGMEEYFEIRFPSPSLKSKHIDELITRNKLTKNNINFLNALKAEGEEEGIDFVFNKSLSPVFRFSNSEIGIFTYEELVELGEETVSANKETDLIMNSEKITDIMMENYGEIKFFPELLDSVFNQKDKPELYIYTTSKIDSTQIKDLGVFVDDCLEYYEYSINTTNVSIKDSVLFSSPYKIDLVYGSNPRLDSILKNDSNDQYVDCPNSMSLQKSFARLKGADNLYFVYADAFPFNNELKTPSRALVLISKNNEPIYLWYEDIDLFGCSCL